MVFWEIRIAKETWAQDFACLTKSSYPLMLLFEYSLKGNKVHRILFIVYIWLILHHCTHKWVGALISFISLLFRVMQAASLKKWIPYAGVFALLKNTPVFYCTDTGHLRFVVLFLSDTRWFLRQLLGGKRGSPCQRFCWWAWNLDKIMRQWGAVPLLNKARIHGKNPKHLKWLRLWLYKVLRRESPISQLQPCLSYFHIFV